MSFGLKKKHLKARPRPPHRWRPPKYKLFSRFWTGRNGRRASAAPGGAPDAAAFGDAEVVAFLQMLQRENKVMLHEGTVMII